MTLRSPAIRWHDALPSGNGTLGAMVFGNVLRETVVLNHEELFLPYYPPKPVAQMSQHLPRLREMVLAGKYEEAQRFWLDEVFKQGGGMQWPDPFQPLGDLRIDREPAAAFSEYSRRLDFRSGEVTVQWNEGDACIRRRLFVSRADGAVVAEMSAVGDTLTGSMTLAQRPIETYICGPATDFTLAKSIQYTTTSSTGAKGGRVHFRGTYPNGRSFGAVARVVATGGRLEPLPDGGVRFAEVGRLLIFVRPYVPAEAENTAALTAELDRIEPDYETLLSRHVAIHGKLYNRVKLDLRDRSLRGRSNEDILLEAFQGDVPTGLHERMFNFGRYLLISSTGKLPPNLQGVWNGDWNPAWTCDFHADENVQIMHWQILPGGLAELMKPLVDLYRSQMAGWRENAMSLYGCRGVMAPAVSSTHGRLHHVLEHWPWHFWTAGAGWLAQHYYEYWLYTGDREFLAAEVLPLLKDIALFYEDFLQAGPDGKYFFTPSFSPENQPPGHNVFLTVNATMDIAVAREALTHLLEACRELNLDDPQIPKWREMLAKLPEYQVNADGAIREWAWPGLDDNYAHRHQSHIYPAFPGLEAHEKGREALLQACRVAVEKRLVVGLRSQTSWSLAHMASIFGRLGWADRAKECLELICRTLLGPNGLTYHNDWRMSGLAWPGLGSRTDVTAFQADANMGYPAAIMEMLLFSAPGRMTLLPALPETWREGSIRGLRGRGGFEVDMFWRDGKLTKTVIRSKLGRPCEVRYGDKTFALEPKRGSVTLDEGLHVGGGI